MAEGQVNIQLPTDTIVNQLFNRLVPLVKEEIKKLSGQSEEYLTSSEVCQIYRISESTLNRRRKRGDIAFKRFGRSVRYPKSQFETI